MLWTYTWEETLLAGVCSTVLCDSLSPGDLTERSQEWPGSVSVILLDGGGDYGC